MELSNYFEPPVIAISGARIGSEPSFTVQWDALHKVYTFTPKAGVTITKLSNGRIKLSTTNPEDQKWEGEYRIYFKKNDHNAFIGFYSLDMSGPCTYSKYTEDCKPLCQERWLPEEIYDREPCKEFDDIQIYGNSEVTNTTLTELGGTTDDTAEAFDYKDAHLVPAKCKNGEVIGYHVFYFNFREDKPVLQIGKDKLDEFKNNYDVYTTGGGLYYAFGDPSIGKKKTVAGELTGNWAIFWEGFTQEWGGCFKDPTCMATIILATGNGVLSQVNSKLPKTITNAQLGEEFSNLSGFKPGFSKDQVINFPKGQRPSPTIYLEEGYINTHYSRFDEGASFLIPKESLDKYGRSMIGRPDGQFVMSKIEMDDLLLKAGGNLSVIEKELGIPFGLWKNKELVRINISKPRELNLRIPSGNESGANNLWLPGGKLPKGYNEAVINQIPAGKYTETILNIK